jgi:hypothetical protein
MNITAPTPEPGLLDTIGSAISDRVSAAADSVSNVVSDASKLVSGLSTDQVVGTLQQLASDTGVTNLLTA